MSITHVYLSPHLDDAALSCGGTIWEQTQAGQRVIVINVFAGIPDYRRLPAFAQEKHAIWGSPQDVVAARRAEDRTALTRLGAQVVNWDYLDAIYRLDGGRVMYPDEAGIFGQVDPADSVLHDRIATDVEVVLGEVGDAVCYAPLAIGNHVDHQVVRDVGLTLMERGRRVLFYEDFPYVWWEVAGTSGGRGEAGRGAGGRGEAGRIEGSSEEGPPLRPASPLHRPASPLPDGWQPTIHSVDVAPKIAAIACYTSQVTDLFDSQEAMAEAVRSYARLVGTDHHAERFWHFVGTTYH
ncbi:MAG: PIG-L deacetylase family protein [Anaerolineae bacterium]